MDNLTEIISCPLCYEMSNKPYGFESKEVNGTIVKLGLNKCSKCNMQFISPRLNQRGLTLLYESYDTQTVSGVYNTEEDVSTLEYKSFSKYIQKKLPEGGCILDVGCGIGNLLAEFEGKDKYEISGIEFSEVAASRAKDRGFEVTIGDLIDKKLPSKKFDAVVLLYVLEHVPNPREILNEINRILKDDGFFFMAVPNYRYLRVAFDNVFSRFLFGKKVSLHAEEHLQNFTPITLKKMLKLENFTIMNEYMATPLNTGTFFIKKIKWLMYGFLKILFLLKYNAGGIHIIAKKHNEN